MENYFEDKDLQILINNNVKLPNIKNVISKLMSDIKAMYREFNERGKFYDYKTIYVPINIPPRIQRLEEVDRSPLGVYELVEDWAQEYTGDKGAYFTPITYEMEIEYIVREYIEDMLGVDLIVDNYIQTGEAENEITGEILSRSIFEIT